MPIHPRYKSKSPQNAPNFVFFVIEKTPAEDGLVEKVSSGNVCIYRGLPPMNSDHLRTSEGTPSGRGSFSLMHWAKSMAV
jgi:hypothetical protein